MTAPAWFGPALEVAWEDHETIVDGTPVRWLAAGSGPPLVFVHGGTAHGHWWTPVAARFSGTHRVLVPDLSGHGRSGHRQRYAAVHQHQPLEQVRPGTGRQHGHDGQSDDDLD